MTAYITGLIGVWMVTDGLYSILTYLPGRETWLRNHSYQAAQVLAGVALVIIGGLGLP